MFRPFKRMYFKRIGYASVELAGLLKKETYEEFGWSFVMFCFDRSMLKKPEERKCLYEA